MIIFLTGVTSTGKSSAAQAIQNIDTSCLRLSNDMFQHAMAPALVEENYFSNLSVVIELMYRTAKWYSDSGYNIIIDGMLLDLDGFREHFGMSHSEVLKSRFEGSSYITVHLTCPAEICRQRNVARGDRGEFQSDWQAEHMDSGIPYDLEIDTSLSTPEQCAVQIMDYLHKNH